MQISSKENGLIRPLLCLILISCGPIKNWNKSPVNHSVHLFESGILCGEQQDTPTKEVLMAKKAVSTIFEFSRISKMSTEQSREKKEASFSPLTPLLVNKRTLKTLLESLEMRSFELFGAPLSKLQEASAGRLSLARSDRVSYSKFLDEANYLHELVGRYENLNCRYSGLKKKYPEDVRIYYELQKQSPTEWKFDQISRVCQKVKEKSYPCAVELHLADDDEFIEKGKQFLEQYYQLFITPYFKITEQKRNFNCQQVEEETFLRVGIDYKSLGDRSFASSLIFVATEKWRGKRSMVQFYDDPNGIQIKWTKDQVSHVKSLGSRTIYLNEKLKRNVGGAGIILAHELGHVFGYKDCYFEILNLENQELVYYELDKANLMCSVNEEAKVPEEFLDQLVETRCQFDELL